MSWVPLLLVAAGTIQVQAAAAATAASTNRLLSLTTVDDYLNLCLDGRNQKSEPGPEDSLFSGCSPYKDRSCCTPTISESLHLNETWYNFRLDHCAPLSTQCRQHFDKDLCFYECSADLGPWLVQEGPRSWRKERFYQVPLCQSECEQWFRDCQDDLTCVINWSAQFQWSNGRMACPNGAKCRTFKAVFGNATSFCEHVWDGSYKVVSDSQPCMKLWFDARSNPNAKVALARAKELVAGQTSSGGMSPCSPAASLLLLCLASVATTLTSMLPGGMH